MSNLMKDYATAFPSVITLEDCMRQALRLHDEIKRLQHESMSQAMRLNDEIKRLQKQISQLETERDQWQKMAVRGD